MRRRAAGRHEAPAANPMTPATPVTDAEPTVAETSMKMHRRRALVELAAAPAGFAALVTVSALALAGCASSGRRAGAPALAPEVAANVVLTAVAFLDTPYRHGGTGAPRGGEGRAAATDGFDCSGFTRHVYERSLGLALPRTAWEQAGAPALADVALSELEPADLVFFNTLRRPHSHVGIYIGQGRFIHAPRVGTAVRLEDMRGPAGRYWSERFDGARRAMPGRGPLTQQGQRPPA